MEGELAKNFKPSLAVAAPGIFFHSVPQQA